MTSGATANVDIVTTGEEVDSVTPTVTGVGGQPVRMKDHDTTTNRCC